MAGIWIQLGMITRPHGIRGEFCVDLYADSPDLMCKSVFLENSDGTRKPCRISEYRQHRNIWIVRMKGVSDRTQAEQLRGKHLVLSKDELPALGDDEAYLAELVGRDIALPDGTVIGTLDHVEFPAGQMLWAIRDNVRETLFPARPEFIVSLESPIIINPPEGLLEACSTPLKK